MKDNCNCPIHLYHVAHICACGEIISHSQNSFDYHKWHGGMINFPPSLYEHGMEPRRMFDMLCLTQRADRLNPEHRAVFEFFEKEKTK